MKDKLYNLYYDFDTNIFIFISQKKLNLKIFLKRIRRKISYYLYSDSDKLDYLSIYIQIKIKKIIYDNIFKE